MTSTKRHMQNDSIARAERGVVAPFLAPAVVVTGRFS